MMNEAILLPGQGAQFEGMGRDWAEAYPAAAEVWRQADEVLGFSLTQAAWSSGDKINRTDVAQPAIYTTGVAILAVLVEQGLDLAALPLTAGLSLGEYTALYAAGALSFEDGLRLVRLRGEAMQDAAEAIPSSMLSLMGATEESARALAKVAAEAGICQVANLNSPSQIILSGEHAALDVAEAAAKEHGIRRCRRLVVAGGFHSECMRPAADRLDAALESVEIRAPRVPVIPNVSAEPTQDPAVLKRLLSEQVCAPVLWERSMRRALADGVSRFLEPGPGTVLAGLMKKIEPEAQVRSVAKPAALETTPEGNPQAPQ